MTYAYENNWMREIVISDIAETVSLDISDGRYRLVLRDEGRTRFEVVDAKVEGGVAALIRGLEGTDAQDWPAGSFIYLALTAEQIAQLQGLSGPAYPGAAGVVASAGTVFTSELDGSVWICNWSDGDSSDWVELEQRARVVTIASSLVFSAPGKGEYLLLDGATAEFSFDDVIYSNLVLTGSPRSYQSAGPTYLRANDIADGGMVLVATPLTEYLGVI